MTDKIFQVTDLPSDTPPPHYSPQGVEGKGAHPILPMDTVKLDLRYATDTTRDYFDATASNWNTSAHSAPWRVSLYKDGQSNRRVGVF